MNSIYQYWENISGQVSEIVQRNGLLGLAAGIMAEVKIFAKLSTGGAVLVDEVLAQGSLAPPVEKAFWKGPSPTLLSAFVTFPLLLLFVEARGPCSAEDAC